MRLVMSIGSLRAGGAEHIISMLASEFANRGHDVSVLTLSPRSEDFYKVSAPVRRVSVRRESESSTFVGGAFANIGRVVAIRRALNQLRPHVVVSFITEMNVLVAAACIGRKNGLILSERISPTHHRIGYLWRLLRSIFYRRAGVVVLQTKETAHWFRSLFSEVINIAVIPNPVERYACRPLPGRSHAPKYILSAGRLDHQKGFDVLLKGFASEVAPYSSIELWIAGDGLLRESLRLQTESLGLVNRVRFLGQTECLPALMAGATAFVLASRYEGFPNVLLEALSCGAPVVATDCASGPREILVDGEFGLLVPPEDPVALGAAIQRLISDTSLAEKFACKAPQATIRYALPAIADSWEVLLSQEARTCKHR